MNRQVVLYSIIYVALFIFFTLFFIPVNYPPERLTDQVNGWIWAASKGTLTVENARIKLPLSLEVGEITLDVGQGRSVEMGDAVVGMRFLTLLTGKRGADVRLENPWLKSSLNLVSSGEGWDLDVQSMEIELSELPDDVMPFPLRLDGKIGMSLNLLSNDPSQGISSGEVRITSGPIEIGGDLLKALGFAPLGISRVSAVATVKDNVVTLGETAIEGDLTATARGVIRITSDDYLTSRLDLTVELKPGPGNRERLVPVFTMMGVRPRADGTVNFKIRGTVGEPSITM
ncbi:MAG: type II secretion system protein GspN [Zetaproteobacteria bacterium]|nr:type II secretion system protein GspN [Zetaproteobacteria bacterium]